MLKEMTVAELKALCRKKGISGYSGLRKSELIKKCKKSKVSKGSKKSSKKSSKKYSITFKEIPTHFVIIPKGKLGYEKETTIRLRKQKNGKLYFTTSKVKGVRYVQNTTNKKKFDAVSPNFGRYE